MYLYDRSVVGDDAAAAQGPGGQDKIYRFA